MLDEYSPDRYIQALLLCEACVSFTTVHAFLLLGTVSCVVCYVYDRRGYLRVWLVNFRGRVSFSFPFVLEVLPRAGRALV